MRNKPQKPDTRAVVVYAISSLAVLSGTIAFGLHRQRYWERKSAERPSIQVGIVQVDPSYVDSIAKMRQRSFTIDKRLDLLCWPESTLGTYHVDVSDFRDQKRVRASSMPPFVDWHPAAELPCELLAGGKTFYSGAGEDGPFYQTAFLIQPGERIVGRYTKRSLLPIGEYMPGQSYFPRLREWAGLSDIFISGNDARPLVLQNGVRLGVLMCYEDMVPEDARQSVAQGAQALCCLMNGSAFPHTRTLEQHMRLCTAPRDREPSLLRALCCHRSVVCNLGYGRLVSRADTNAEATLVADVPLIDDPTFFGRFGHLFPAACLIVVSAFLAGNLLNFWLRPPSGIELRNPLTLAARLTTRGGDAPASPYGASRLSRIFPGTLAQDCSR